MALLIFKKPRALTRAFFSRLHTAVLGSAYSLSIIFVSPKEIQKLNKQYRGKNAPTDILSFSIGKKSGELYLSMPEVAYRAKAFNMPPPAYLPFLIIHGMLHLKGYDHGRAMEKLEQRYCRKLKLPHPKEFA